ncbi:hypothetical protein Tco_0490972 [Tanacetum coccineum]
MEADIKLFRPFCFSFFLKTSIFAVIVVKLCSGNRLLTTNDDRGSDIGIQRKAKLFNEWESLLPTDGNRLSLTITGQERQMRMVFGANGGNQFRQYAGQNVGIRMEWATMVFRILGMEMYEGSKPDYGLSCLIAQGRKNRNPTPSEEFDIDGWPTVDLDEIEEVNANLHLMANFAATIDIVTAPDLTKLPSMIQTDQTESRTTLLKNQKAHSLGAITRIEEVEVERTT